MREQDAVPRAEVGQGRTARDIAGKFMMFKLAEEAYGLEIVEVREIIGLMAITRVPRGPEFLRGVINLRGKVIPVMDLRVRFGMPAAVETDQTVIIVVQSSVGGKSLTMGILVDQVLEVLSIESDDIEPPPCLGPDALDGDFLLGVGKTAERVVFLLDIGKVLTPHEAATLLHAAA
jgi:purine-binding chemotaxis protein CheW